MDQLEGSPILQKVLGSALPKLEIFYKKLADEGEPRGIIGPRDVDIIWERHILNSHAVVPFIEDFLKNKKQKTVADIGSGGGFPGIVAAACLPEVSFTLIEPMERRVEWLQECVNSLELNNVDIYHGRAQDVAEDIKAEVTNPFTIVTCRAVAPMTKLSNWALPLVAEDGKLLAIKGQSAQNEIDKAIKEIKKNKGINPRVLDAPVGEYLQSTFIISVDKRK
ncbi:MAG: 16S rRNA (guanine(527)-N(7))-methyltransferase RsmG [Bifidobacteriaceae bacterium]|nr:16S rRNA (guanine(527)-N(7))-methyltransferase RsmG [Bifidobacteriaceae bacterium]